MKKTISLFLSILLLIGVMVPVSATAEIDTDDDVGVEYILEREIIGGSDAEIDTGITPQGIIFDALIPNFVCDKYSNIHFTFNNLGDPIDILEVTVKTPTQEVGKTFGNIPSGEPGTVHTIRVPMESIHEDLLVTYKVHDRGDTDGVAQQSGHRDLPDSLVKQWAPGSKNDPEETLTYHFKKHKKEIGTDSIYTYCERAILLRNSLKASEYVRDVGGATPNSKRYERNDYYIVVSGNRNTGLIVMYGKIIRT